MVHAHTLALSIASAITAVSLMPHEASSQFSVALSDEFSDAATLGDWTPLPSNSVTAALEDIDTSEPGKLVMVPADLSQNGWFGSSVGPFRYKLVTGDFVATSHIVAGNVGVPNDPGVAPTGTYNSAGFVARDPTSASSPSGESWIMYNHGTQVFDATAGHALATESKTTIDSTSVLTLRPVQSETSNAGELMICRSASLFHMFRRMDDETSWTLEETYSRPDLPETLQVGLVVNGWTNATLRAQFDYFRILNDPVTDADDCLAQLPEPGLATVLATGCLVLAGAGRKGRSKRNRRSSSDPTA